MENVLMRNRNKNRQKRICLSKINHHYGIYFHAYCTPVEAVMILDMGGMSSESYMYSRDYLRDKYIKLGDCNPRPFYFSVKKNSELALALQEMNRG